MKMMSSDDMEFSGKQHFRGRDYAAFLSGSQNPLIENKITRLTSEQMCWYKFSSASSHAYIACHMNVNRTRVGSCDFWNMLCQYTLWPGSWIRERRIVI